MYGVLRVFVSEDSFQAQAQRFIHRGISSGITCPCRTTRKESQNEYSTAITPRTDTASMVGVVGSGSTAAIGKAPDHSDQHIIPVVNPQSNRILVSTNARHDDISQFPPHSPARDTPSLSDITPSFLPRLSTSHDCAPESRCLRYFDSHANAPPQPSYRSALRAARKFGKSWFNGADVFRPGELPIDGISSDLEDCLRYIAEILRNPNNSQIAFLEFASLQQKKVGKGKRRFTPLRLGSGWITQS
ncbi:hypothetical protein HOY82DRAFT_642105 [Tuber indicum]|nr:hypothetical protein HOY82DRAFT_642105 [Tuber indicum]